MTNEELHGLSELLADASTAYQQRDTTRLELLTQQIIERHGGDICRWARRMIHAQTYRALIQEQAQVQVCRNIVYCLLPRLGANSTQVDLANLMEQTIWKILAYARDT